MKSRPVGFVTFVWSFVIFVPIVIFVSRVWSA